MAALLVSHVRKLSIWQVTLVDRSPELVSTTAGIINRRAVNLDSEIVAISPSREAILTNFMMLTVQPAQAPAAFEVLGLPSIADYQPHHPKLDVPFWFEARLQKSVSSIRTIHADRLRITCGVAGVGACHTLYQQIPIDVSPQESHYNRYNRYNRYNDYRYYRYSRYGR